MEAPIAQGQEAEQMKLNSKALTIMGVLTASFLTVIYFPQIRDTYLNIAATTVLFSATIYVLFFYILVDRVADLNKEIKLRQAEKKPTKIKVELIDEVTEIADAVNSILEKSQLNHKQFETRIDERTMELQRINNELKQELNSTRFTERRLKDDKDCLSRIARYDNLTTLPNRVFFNEILNKSISHSKRHNKILSILLIDLDSFKNVTAAVGLEKSDIVLKEIGKRFANVIRTEDILAKFDGDEFAVLLTDIGQAKFASTVAEKILQVCAHPIKIDNYEFKITASIGICVYPHDGASLESLLMSAEEALYKAKHSGGSQFKFFTRELDLEAREYIQVESALRKAIQNNEITLSYQPKISIKNGNIQSLEVLMRWEHPVLGIIPPSKFVTVAEENNTIMQIGEWALREACQTNKLWQEQGYEHFTVAMKLSPKQFYHPDMIKIIRGALEKSGLDPKYLEIELAEKTVMDDVEQAMSVLLNLKSLGVQISIDHFGVGYTSLRYLKQFPITNIKIDRSYISGVPNNPDDSAITTAIIALAHSLGLEVVAEGVETAEQVQFLANNNCDMVQGYFLSHPQPAQKIVLQFAKLRDEVIV